MGITTNCSKFLFYAKSKGVDFQNTLMLGRQFLFTTNDEIARQASYFLKKNIDKSNIKRGSFAEPLFKILGASKIDSMDMSSYEGATILHDLNKPIPIHLRNQYSVVFDGGTLEHIFNFPIAIRNCMDALRVGGHFISVTPTNNQSGHGFYQFSPELYYSLFIQENGFKAKLVCLAVDSPGGGIENWYEVANPNDVKSRVTFNNSYQTFLLVIGEKTHLISEDKLLNVQQSDYEDVWSKFDDSQTLNVSEKLRPIVDLYKRKTPKWLRGFIYKMRHLGKNNVTQINGLGNGNRSHFKKIVP